MEASTGKLYEMIGAIEPILKCHALDKINILLWILEYTLMQSIMGILSLKRFTEEKGKITLIFVLSTWVLLCDGRRRGGVADPFHSPVRHGNTAVGIIRGDDSIACFSLRGCCRQDCPQLGRDWLCEDGLYLDCFSSLCHHELMLYGFVLSTFEPVEPAEMSEGKERVRNDAVTESGTGSSFVRSSVKSVIKALSGTRFATPGADAKPDAERSDRNFSVIDFPDEVRHRDSLGHVIQGTDSLRMEVSRLHDEFGTRDREVCSGTTDISPSRNICDDRNASPSIEIDEKIRSLSTVYGGPSIGNAKSEGRFDPEIRSLFEGPEIRSHYEGPVSSVREDRPLFGGFGPPASFPTDTVGLGTESCGRLFHPDVHRNPLPEPSPHAAFSSFLPGQVGRFDRGGVSE